MKLTRTDRARPALWPMFCALLLLIGFVPPSARAATPTPLGLPGRSVTSPDGVAYSIYSGEVPSFDGLPLAVDVTLPANATYPLPLVAMFHGWGQERRFWQSETIANPDPVVSGWNNVAFAARGYAVLTYTIRGWHDSCGPADAADGRTPATLPLDCASREYWVHLADPRYEIRDAQHLIGRLVDEGVVAADRIGVTGQSYGGGHSWLLAMLNDRSVELDDSLTPWRSPAGTPLSIAAAVPQFTWASLTNSLAPNGRATDTSLGDVTQLNTPVGVPIQSYISGLYANGPALNNGFFSPPGLDPSSDLTTWHGRFTAGNPFDPSVDPVLRRAVEELDRRSPLYMTPGGRVPVFQIQGLTDPLFPPNEAVMMRNRVLGWDARYPIKSFFGDLGHSNATNPGDVWEAAHNLGYAFLDHYLRDQGPRPASDVTLLTTRCVPGQGLQQVTAKSWAGLSKAKLTLVSDLPQLSDSGTVGPENALIDPIVNSGCLTTPVAPVEGGASWRFPVTTPATLIGQPTVTLRFSTTGPDTQLQTRLWDVAPDGASQTLISRGVYRHLAAPGSTAEVTFQLSANGWELLPGHILKLEVVGNDAPSYQASKVPFTITVTGVRVDLPFRGTIQR